MPRPNYPHVDFRGRVYPAITRQAFFDALDRVDNGLRTTVGAMQEAVAPDIDTLPLSQRDPLTLKAHVEGISRVEAKRRMYLEAYGAFPWPRSYPTNPCREINTVSRRTVSFQGRDVTCQSCGGLGLRSDSHGWDRACLPCSGTGREPADRSSASCPEE